MNNYQIIKGFKSFNHGLISEYNFTFKENTCYHLDGKIKYQKNGFHFCERLEDTLRYYTAMKDDIDIARVVGFGKVIKQEVEGYTVDDYEVLVASDIKILNVMSRKEIIDEMLSHQSNFDRMSRFISLYKLTEEEIQVLKSSLEYEGLNKYIDYYQYGDKDAFTRKR